MQILILDAKHSPVELSPVSQNLSKDGPQSDGLTESRVFIASVSSEEDILQSLLSTEQTPGSSYHICRALHLPPL